MSGTNVSGQHSSIHRYEQQPTRRLAFVRYSCVKPDGFTCSVCNDDDDVVGVEIRSKDTQNFHIVCQACVERMAAALKG